MEEINVAKKEEAQVEKMYAFFKRLKPSFKSVLLVIISVFLSIMVFSLLSYLFYESPEDVDSEEKMSSDCSVIGINLHGSIVTYIPEHAEGDSFFDYDQTASEDVTWSIRDANRDSDIKAILIEVDSHGGSPVAGEEIANEVKNSKKPVIAVIRDAGLSTAYLAISSADKIFASANSDVGSIGVTMSYLSNVEKNKKDGYSYIDLSSGKFKDSGDPDKVLTAEEKILFMRDINILYHNFVKAVAENRQLSIDTVKSFADGSSFLGERAKELEMIDEIGGMMEAKDYIEELIKEEVLICW